MASDTCFAPAPLEREEARAQPAAGSSPSETVIHRRELSPGDLPRLPPGGALFHDTGLARAANASLRAGILRQTQQTAGNRAAQRAVLPVQRKLAVSEPGDPLEQEADRVATAVVQRAPARQDPDSRAPLPAHRSPAVDAPDAGSPLPSQVRAQVEPLLGADLSPVRVHDSPAAQRAAIGLNARAFTDQNHIWLAPQQSAADVGLMAHEATHVVQQATGQTGAPQPRIQRAIFGRTQHPNQPAYPRPPDPYPSGMQCDQRALAAIKSETVELKGTPDFKQSYWLAEGIRCARPDPVWVRVRFGGLASGSLQIRMTDPPPSIIAPGSPLPKGDYETVDDHAYIGLTHPAFPGAGPLAPPRMYLTVRNSVVTGRISFIPYGTRLTSLADLSNMLRAQALERVLGWQGLVDVTPAGGVNEVKDGVLRFALHDFTFGMQDLQGLGGVTTQQADFTGTGTFSVTDEATSFSAETTIKAEGVSEAKMPLQRAQGRIFGSASLNLTMAPRDAFNGLLSGSLQGSYVNGIMTITGTARYRSRRLNGSVTVLVAPRGVAWTEVFKQLPTGAPPVTAGAALAPGHVVVGWGSLDFRVNDWLTGHASVVVDPDGFITSHGILRPTVEYQFLDEPGRYEVNKEIAKLTSPTATFATVGIASLTGQIDAILRAGGRIGPARLYGLEIEGQFSTRPGTVFTGRITGRANLSAQASVAARLTGSLSGSVGTPPAHVRVVTVAVSITGQATLRAYAELQPTFERIAGPDPDEAQYKITGKLTAAGAIDLGLSGSVKFSIVSLGPTIELGKVQYPLGGVGIETTFSHILGSKDPIEIDITSADFDEAQFTGFIQDLFDESAPEDEGDHEATLGQTGAPPPLAPPRPTQFRATFTMNGTPHSLWLEHTPGPVLKMASNGDDSLDEKLRNEIAQVEQQRKAQLPGEEADLLAAEAQSARSLLSRSVAVEHSLVELESESRENPDVAGVEELASGLSAYAAQYDKTDLAVSAPPPAPAGGATAAIDAKGRYIITNREELEAVRAAKPARPDDLDSDAEAIWNRYAGDKGYFDEAIRVIEKDLSRPNYTVRHDPPLTWPAYIDARGFFDKLSEKKDFQAELRQSVLDERGDVDPSEAEIDVGLKKGRQRVRYADLIISDASNNLEVYSVKVHNVFAQTQRLPDDQAVRDWIRTALSDDIDEAVKYYGGQLSFRRRYRSTAEGRAGTKAEGRHPRFEQSVFVNRVILVWRGNSDLVPERFRQYVLDTGRDIGITQRASSRIKCEVKLVP